MFEGQENGWNKGRKGDCWEYGFTKARALLVDRVHPPWLSWRHPTSPHHRPCSFFPPPPADIKPARLDDYPEQAMLACIGRGWCAKWVLHLNFANLLLIQDIRCTAPSNNLDLVHQHVNVGNIAILWWRNWSSGFCGMNMDLSETSGWLFLSHLFLLKKKLLWLGPVPLGYKGMSSFRCRYVALCVAPVDTFGCLGTNPTMSAPHLGHFQSLRHWSTNIRR